MSVLDFFPKGGVPLEHLKGGGFAVTVFNRLGVFFAHNSIFAHIFRICHRRIDPTSFWPPFDLHDLQNHKCFLDPLKFSILGWFGPIIRLQVPDIMKNFHKQEQTPYETQLRSSVGQKAHIFFRLSLLQLEYCKMLICLRILLSWIW